MSKYIKKKDLKIEKDLKRKQDLKIEQDRNRKEMRIICKELNDYNTYLLQQTNQQNRKNSIKLQKLLIKYNNLQDSIDYLKISIASPSRIKSWADRILPDLTQLGEIIDEFKKDENILVLKGLYCEKIFGPIENWKCQCGKYFKNKIVLSIFKEKSLNQKVPFIYNSFKHILYQKSNKKYNNICENCKVEIIDNRIRSYRMGYISLSVPIVHIWYISGTPNYLLLFLRCTFKKISLDEIKEIIYSEYSTELNYFLKNNSSINTFYYNNYTFNKKELFSELNFRFYFPYFFKIQLFKKKKFSFFSELKENSQELGTEMLKNILEQMDIVEEKNILRHKIDSLFPYFLNLNKIRRKSRRNSLFLKLRIFENFIATKTSPSWMILTILPVLPAGLRDITESENQIILEIDITDCYKEILMNNLILNTYLKENRILTNQISNLKFSFINYNQFLTFLLPTITGVEMAKKRVFIFKKEFIPKLKKEYIELKNKNCFTIINIKRNLQRNIDALIGYSQGKSLVSSREKQLQSLTSILSGKWGQFRQKILGKCIDYSGRAVITPNPLSSLIECSLPYRLAKTIFLPFLIQFLREKNITEYLIQLLLEENFSILFFILKELIKRHTVLLHRSPTLHRNGIQAFYPTLSISNTIGLNPLLCSSFNADFDGDQMSVYLPLFKESSAEIQLLMLPSSHILHSQGNTLNIRPVLDIVFGCYYLTLMYKNKNNLIQTWFKDETEALLLFYQKKITLHTPILVKNKISKNNFKFKRKKLYFFNNLKKKCKKLKFINFL